MVHSDKGRVGDTVIKPGGKKEYGTEPKVGEMERAGREIGGGLETTAIFHR